MKQRREEPKARRDVRSTLNKLSILSNKLIISSSNKLSILVQAILVQRYSCAPNIL